MKVLQLERPGYPDVRLEAYLSDEGIKFGQNMARPAIVICPGGGYVYLCPREAEPIALAYAAKGFNAFILRYSVGRQALDFRPLADISWAIGLIREKAEEWNVIPDQIAACGFSAGGHLALASGLLAENKPNALVLGYPAVNADPFPGAKNGDFMLKLLTTGLDDKTPVTEAQRASLDLVAQVDENAPPMFLYGTSEDFLHQGFVDLMKAYDSHGLHYEAHIFQFGPHGMGLCQPESAEGSAPMVDARNAHWQPLSVSWLLRIFGEPGFVQSGISRMREKMEELLGDVSGFESSGIV